MAFKSLLLSKDTDLVQTLARLLKDLDISVEPCSEPFAAAKRLMDQHFEAILVDCEDEQGAGWVLQSARMATASKKSVTIAIVNAQNANRGGPRAGENFVIQKPIVLKQAEATLRAARGLMGDSGTAPSGSGSAPASVPVPKPAAPVAMPTPHEAAPGQGKPSPEFFDELSAVVDKLGPQRSPAKPAAVASTFSGSAAAAAPAREKPVMAPPPVTAAPAAPMAAVPEPLPPRPEPLPAPRPAAQTWPGLTAASSAPSPKPEVAALLPLGATSAEMKPAMVPAQEQPSSKALDDARRRMEASAAPTWRTSVEERHEAPVPRFSGFAADEEPKQGGSIFKKIAVLMVLVSLALYGYSWYRGHQSAGMPAEPTNVPDNVQSPAPAPAAAVPQPAPDSHAGSPTTNSSNMPADNFGGDRTPDAEPPVAPQLKPGKSAPHSNAATEVIAPDTTTVESTGTDLPPAPLVVEGGKRHNGTPKHAVESVTPPSLNTVTATAKPGLGGVVSSTPVDLPQLAPAAPQRVQVSQGVTQGLLVRRVQPQYPAMARENRVEGDVLVEAVIDKNGAVRDVKAISGPALLIPPALQAVRQWRYKPYLLNSQPVEVVTQIKLQFRL